MLMFMYSHIFHWFSIINLCVKKYVVFNADINSHFFTISAQYILNFCSHNGLITGTPQVSVMHVYAKSTQYCFFVFTHTHTPTKEMSSVMFTNSSSCCLQNIKIQNGSKILVITNIKTMQLPPFYDIFSIAVMILRFRV